MQRYDSIWKVFVFVTFAFLAVKSPGFATSDKIARVFLLGGQSNMAGGGKTAKLPPPYSEPFEKVMIWNWGKWTALSPRININKPGQFGPEISFGHAIAEVFPGEDIRLIKYARGGTALYDDWSPEVKGEQYTGFMRTTKAALAELESSKVRYEIAGMLWLQGESDAHENQAEAYGTNLTAFIAHMRTEFKTPDMPFIIARVRSHFGGATGQAKIVREAQVRVADADRNVGWFDTDDCSMHNAGHYDAAGLIEIGKRFAATFQEVTSKARK